jgi:hypothetical protein
MPSETVLKRVPLTQTVTYTVRARNKENGKQIWLCETKGPMAPRFGWSYMKPDIGCDMPKHKLKEKAKSCSYPISIDPDLRTLKIFQIVDQSYSSKEYNHIPVN